MLKGKVIIVIGARSESLDVKHTSFERVGMRFFGERLGQEENRRARQYPLCRDESLFCKVARSTTNPSYQNSRLCPFTQLSGVSDTNLASTSRRKAEAMLLR